MYIVCRMWRVLKIFLGNVSETISGSLECNFSAVFFWVDVKFYDIIGIYFVKIFVCRLLNLMNIEYI